MSDQGFAGLRVLALESRRSAEMARLIENSGGIPTVAPSMREVPLESNTEALEFARVLLEGEFHVVIFLTGVGTRTLARAVETAYPREKFAEALRRVAVVARGPKPIAALKELGVPVSVAVPEPNTWREILEVLDAKRDSIPLQGRRVAVQEYGVSNPELLAGLAGRGATVTRVPVYQWALPEDTAPLRSAIHGIARGEFDAVLFTTSIQVVHLFKIAADMKLDAEVRRALARTAIGSIGPTTSEEIKKYGLSPDLEPSHPKMGYLVKELSERSGEILQRKRAQQQ